VDQRVADARIALNVLQESIQPELFLKSLSNQKFSEGRSGSFFCFSPDKCFIIKTIPESEAKLLNKILPAYYQYIGNNPDSRLMRFYGLHAIKMHYGDQVFVIVMSNAFRTHRKIHERYDLKVPHPQSHTTRARAI
jgi:1-phosphatidylinositol-4-phosphate 5-kinase